LAQHGLKIEPRTDTGTTSAKRLRAKGKIPAVLYGHGADPQHVAVEAKAFEDLLHRGGRTSLIPLDACDGRGDTSLIRYVQFYSVSRLTFPSDIHLSSSETRVGSKFRDVATGVAR